MNNSKSTNLTKNQNSLHSLLYILLVALKYGHDNAERIIAAVVATAVVGTEHTSTSIIVVIATTGEERTVSAREVRVITVPAVRARSAI